MIRIQHVCAAVSVLLLSISAWSADSVTIEQVHTQYDKSTTQLDPAAIPVIQDYWNKTIDVMMLSEDTEKVVQLRLEIKKYKGSDPLSYYSSAYLKAAKEHLKVAIETVAKWEEGARKSVVERNLMILVAEMGNVGLVELTIPELSSKDPMVRYWAVRSLTSKEIIEQSGPKAVTKDDKRSEMILAALDGYLQSTSDVLTIPLIADFSGQIKMPASMKLLIGIADRRIDAYMKWTVTDERIDAVILKTLGTAGVESMDSALRQDLLSRFGQLYACVLGRYMQAAASPAVSKEQLISVIIEVEDKFLVNPKHVPGWASKFKTDISTNKPLKDNYTLLFGGSGITGELATKLNFNYGKDSSGKPLMVPRPLGTPPAAAAPETASTAAKP